MNIELIANLVEKADRDFQLALVPADIVEKFAESLIRECIGCCDIVSKIEWPETPTYDLAIDGCKLKMKQHFGVEE